MDLELIQEHIGCYDPVLNTAVSQEETLEAIVPDACPDILRIVDVVGQLYLTGKMLSEGSMDLSGSVRAWILYQPEDGSKLCRMEVNVPFSAHIPVPGLDNAGCSTVVPALRSLDARALNPRKVLVRADLLFAVQAFRPRDMVVCSAIRAQEKDGIQQRTAQHSTYMTAAVQEKAFAFSDELRLPMGSGGRPELLCTRAAARCTESKIIGNKLIFKGETDLQILYQQGNELCSVRFPMSFSQIMEVADVGESADCTVELCVTELDCALAGEEQNTLHAAVELLAQAVVCEQRPLVLLQDAYSTGQEMTVESETHTLVQLQERSVRPQGVRELLETNLLVKSVVDAWLSVAEVTQRREGEQLAVTGDLRLKVIYTDEQDELHALDRVLSVSGRLDLPGQCQCRCRCVCPGEVFAAPAAGGIEVRFTLEFHCLTTAEQRVAGIAGARLGEMKPNQAEGRPSVVLRLVAPGEELWDIAKAYSTTQSCILGVNQLAEQEPLPAGQMLLIPGAR